MNSPRQHGPKPRRTANLALRIDPQLKNDLEALAKRDDRSLANFIEHLLKRHTPPVPSTSDK